MLAAGVDLGEVADDHAELLQTIERGELESACTHAWDHQWHYAALPHDAQGRSRRRAG
jgi:hypothetical protein